MFQKVIKKALKHVIVNKNLMKNHKIPKELSELTYTESIECNGGGDLGKKIGYYLARIKCILSTPPPPIPEHMQKYRESKFYLHPGKI